ncbi:flagellin [Cupriavidus sp. AU9028]|uniref:flagellin n=1 Tax=Cupriavidus sp. AU9028 TaxID=2871157 RepID=UPI001C96203A|nr:flagellin [Cupriavidus sp. AU9028]MBY4896792.1 flagellin [Cupriavidus sp. AU9028]
MDIDCGEPVRRRCPWRSGLTWTVAVLGAATYAAASIASAPVAGTASALNPLTGQDLPSARDAMAHWQPVDSERLDALRGGFETGGLQVSFGISRAVYVNGDLVVSTSLVIPDVSRITSEQAARLASALQNTATAGANAAAAGAAAGQTAADAANAAVSAALGGLASATSGGTAPAPGGLAGNGGTAAPGTAASAPPNPAAIAQPGQTAAPVPPPLAATPPAAVLPDAPAAVIGTATGTVATNGLLNLVQNGPGNRFDAASLAGTPATVIQNTLNNQSIQSLLTIDAGVNTLQAFRAGVVGAALDSALQRAASLR